MSIETRNPSSGELVEAFEPYTDDQIEAAIAEASAATATLRRMSYKDRAAMMQRAADGLDREKESLAATMTLEMGKTLKSAVAEVGKCAMVCRHYAEHAESYLADRTIKTEASESYVKHLPIGVVLAVMPWNFPLWQVFRFAAPALMAGNSGLLKHASNVPRCALAIEKIFVDAGFPAGSFRTILIGAKSVAKVLADPRIAAATLTGSEPAGRALASQAGDLIKKTVLELGGSDPFLVMPSANLEAAVTAAVTARTMNNGQSCIAAKRFIIHEKIYDEFRDRMVARFEALKVGDPVDASTDIGPLALPSIREELHDQVGKTLNQGARRLVGAQMIDGPGYFYTPGIIDDIPDGSPAATEELFGPVASLFKVSNLEAGVELANGSRFGLGSAIFTLDEEDIAFAVSRLDAGSTFVNSIVASDPRLPFGGTKVSGIGRELSAEGIREFVNIKTVSITRPG